MMKRILLLCLTVQCGMALAEIHDPMEPRGGTFVPPPTQTPEAWKEQTTALPAFPQEGDLVEVATAGTGEYRYLVDTRSLLVGEDRAVRYTVVTTSTRGARSVFREALRCDTGEYKTLAYGRQDAFQEVRDPVWRTNSDAINTSSAMGSFRKEVRAALCDDAYRPRTPARSTWSEA